MDTLVAGRRGIGVHQRRKVVELRNQYTLTDEDGHPIGAVEQVGQSKLALGARLLTGGDITLPVTLRITDARGATALTLRKPWFRYAVTVADGAGTVLGTIAKRIRLGKAVFAVRDAEDRPVSEVRAADWRARDFRFHDASGAEVARVTKEWRGLLTEAATDADSYAVTFEPGTDDRTRSLVLAAALAVDLSMKQKDYVSPLDL